MTIRELNREQRPKYKNHHVDDDDNDDNDEEATTSPLDDMMIRPIDDDDDNNNNNSNIPSPPSSPLQVTFDDNHNNNNHTSSTSSDSLDENSNSNNNNNSSSMPRIPSIGSSLMMMSPLTGNPFSFPHLRSSNSLYELETLSKSASSISLSSYLKDFPISSSSSSSSLNHINNNNNSNSNNNNNNNNNNSNNNNSQNNDQVDLMKSASTYSLSDYVSSANLLKSPSTSSLSALQKSSSSSSLSELHASSLLKSSSCASFSKYQVCDDVDNDDDDGVDVNVDVDGIGCDDNENDDDQHHKSSNIDSSGDGSGVNNMNNNNQKKKKKKKKKSKKKKNLNDNDDDAERSENLSDETMNRNEREQLSSSSRTTRPLSSGVNLLPSSASIISPLDSPVNSVDHGAVVVNNRNNNSLLPSLYDRLLGSSGSAQNRSAPAINVTQPIPPLSQQNHHHQHSHNHSHHSSSHHSHMTSASSSSPPPPPYSHVPHSHSHSYPAASAAPAHHPRHSQHHHHPHCPHHPYSHHHQPCYHHSYPVAPPSSSSELPPNNPHLYKQYSAAFGSAPQNTTVPPSYPPFGFNPVQPSGSSIRMLENHPYMNVVAPTDPYVSQSHLPHQHHQHPSINIQQQQESAHIHPSSVKVHNYSMHAHQEAPPQRSSSPPISTFEQFNKRQNEEQPILNPTLDPNIQVPQGEYVKINGEMYNDRGYKICGHLNQHSKPCQRIGKCPFHWKLTKDKEEGESTAGTGNDNGSPASNTEESDSTPVKNEVAISEQFNQTAAAVMPAPPQRTPMKRGPYKQGWSKEEHLLFLKGLKQHGKGAWKEISTIVGTRTPTQIQSHAQKYFLRQKQKVKNKRSIHDITMDDLSGNNNGRGSRDDPDEEESDSDSSEEEITQSANKRAKTMHDAPRNTMDAPPAAIVTTQARSSPPLPMNQLTPQALHNAHADFQKMVAMFPNIHPNVLAQLIAMNSLQATSANQQPEGTSNSSPPTIDYSLLADQRQKTT